MARHAPPPLQLVPGDKYNFTLGVAAAFALASVKDTTKLPPLIVHQLNAFTNWNLMFITLRILLGQRQWDPFLLSNSVGIFLGFRTGFCQGLDDNMRSKLRRLGLPLPRWLFVMLDHACHTVPPAVLLAKCVRQRQRVHPMNSVYCLVLSTWAAFRQARGRLDSRDIYVPHPWKRAWVAICVGVLTTPHIVDALIARRKGKAALCVAAMLAPYLSTRLDPTLRSTYTFEWIHSLASEEQTAAGATRQSLCSGQYRKNAAMPRNHSAAPLLQAMACS